MNAAQSVSAQFTRQLGSLGITLGGLPAGSSVSVIITGPDSYNSTSALITGTLLTLSNLPTGTYTASAPTTTLAGIRYVPGVASQSPVVNTGVTAGITVTYSSAGPALPYPLSAILFFLLD